MFYFTDNVHPQNAMQMVRALSEAQILFKSNVSTKEGRIQDLPDWVQQPLSSGRKPTILAIFPKTA